MDWMEVTKLLLINFGIFIIVLWLVTTLFLGSWKLSKIVMKEELRWILFPKNRRKRMEYAYKICNELFKDCMYDIMCSKDTEVMEDYKLSIEQAKRIKKMASEFVCDEDILFITEEELKVYIRHHPLFSFICSLSNSIQVFSKRKNEQLYRCICSLGDTNQSEFLEKEIPKVFRELTGINYSNERAAKVFQIKETAGEGTKKIDSAFVYLGITISNIFHPKKYIGSLMKLNEI